MDEDGRVSEMQELQVIDKIEKLIGNVAEEAKSEVDLLDITKPSIEVRDFLNEPENTLTIKVIFIIQRSFSCNHEFSSVESFVFNDVPHWTRSTAFFSRIVETQH